MNRPRGYLDPMDKKTNRFRQAGGNSTEGNEDDHIRVGEPQEGSFPLESSKFHLLR